MMGRAIIGGVAAAVVLFILGFIFFATPLAKLGTGSVGNAEAAAVQQALAANLPETGTYSVPGADTPEQTVMYGQGPIATIHYNIAGYPVGDAGTMIGGFIQLLVVAMLMAFALYLLSKYVASFAERVKLLLLGVLAATVFTRLGEPIWFHHDWNHAIYMFVADTVSLLAAGLVILKLLPAAVYTGAAGAPRT